MIEPDAELLKTFAALGIEPGPMDVRQATHRPIAEFTDEALLHWLMQLGKKPTEARRRSPQAQADVRGRTAPLAQRRHAIRLAYPQTALFWTLRAGGVSFPL
ncbi:MAG: hypothetical protein M5U25_01370 [Planctomycetota bacterium]|nr:hypothetical protein [Planctomycetota bacterium]